MDHPIICFLHFFKMEIQLVQQLFRGWKPSELSRWHFPGENLQLIAMHRQRVGLTIIEILEPVFQMSQEFICRCQLRVFRLRQEVFIPKPR